ncbi:MAG: hypothetical protein BMS9Abin37_2313 [Acidobacteriota bacterium]|nr:MAG: hypothetical protein BMS9Abin37_2313 [Acidobacteriota bacterium]
MPRAGPRTIVAPAYTLTETAHYLQVPAATLRSWVKGRGYPMTLDGSGFVQPTIELPDDDQSLLSFTNLVEVHMLDGIRREHGVQLQKVPGALTTNRMIVSV